MPKAASLEGSGETATAPLTGLERAGSILLLVVVVAFGGLVELRTAFLSRRMGDLNCFLRTAWAVRAGEDIYDIADDNGWHYCYPPLYAILMVPLADPPAGWHGPSAFGFVPFSVSAGIFYLFNVACVGVAAHLLASALERRTCDPAYRAQPRFCRRWWALRLLPILVCLPPIGNTAMKGQVNLQILALLCAWMACLLAGRRLRAGLLLSLAICIKVIPIYLLVQPLWRRDGRQLFGCAVGLLAGLILAPVIAFGPARTVQEYQKYGHVLFGPLLRLSDDKSRHAELLGVNATDSVSVKNALHNWLYRNRAERPEEHHPVEVAAYVLLGVLMTLAVLVRGRQADSPWPETHELAALVLLMVAFSPVSHVHYQALCLPLIMSLLFRRWEGRCTLRVGALLTGALVWFLVANSLPSLPALAVLKDRCLPLFGALPLWALSVLQSRGGPASKPAAPMARLAA